MRGDGAGRGGLGLRPFRVTRQAAVVAGLAAAFLAISRTTGSGWVVVLVCGLSGSLVASAAWPALSLARVRLEADAPRDATVGRPLTVDLAVRGAGGGVQARPLDPPGGWVVAFGSARGEVLVTPERRGVVHAVEVEVRAAAPLGLVWWRRRVRAPLAAPLEVGPRPVDAALPEVVLAGAAGAQAAPRGHLGHDSFRSVREYLPGDPIRLVHWPATARWGSVMVKELEDPDLPRVAIVVDLRGPAAAAEEAASRAAGLALAALAEGVPVTLLTLERGGPVVGEAASPVVVGRRLARAVPGPPPEGPLPPGAMVVRVRAG